MKKLPADIQSKIYRPKAHEIKHFDVKFDEGGKELGMNGEPENIQVNVELDE